MSAPVLYHNPRCSKSRQALALLQEQGTKVDLCLYLENPPDAAQLKTLLHKLQLGSAHALVRNGEPEYHTAGLSPQSSDDDVIQALVRFPRLIQRPILETADAAVIGRPPETVLDLVRAS